MDVDGHLAVGGRRLVRRTQTVTAAIAAQLSGGGLVPCGSSACAAQALYGGHALPGYRGAGRLSLSRLRTGVLPAIDIPVVVPYPSFQTASRTVGTGSARWPPPACGFGAGQSGQSWRRCACSPEKETNNDRGTRRDECALGGRRATRQSNEDRRRFTPDRKRVLLLQGLCVQCEQHPGSTRRRCDSVPQQDPTRKRDWRGDGAGNGRSSTLEGRPVGRSLHQLGIKRPGTGGRRGRRVAPCGEPKAA